MKKFFRSLRLRTCTPTFKIVVPTMRRLTGC